MPAGYTSSLGAVESLGNEIIWVGAGALWRYTPGAAEPERIVKQDRANPIVSIAGSTSGYVYVTRERSTDYTANRWRLWFLARPGAMPVLLDKYDNENVPLPEFDIDGDWIVWAAIHGKNDQNAKSVLRAVPLDALDQPREVVAYQPAVDTNIWNPQLNGDEVWYGVNHNDWTNGLAYPRVEMVDLSADSPTPVRYGEDVRAFMPSATDAVVAWSGNSDYTLAAGNAGELYIYWRATGALTEVAIPEHSWDRVSYPSVGNRFVAWWDDIATHFFLYDLQTQEVRVVARYDPTGDELIRTPSLKGDLLAFVRIPGENLPHQLRWAVLPD